MMRTPSLYFLWVFWLLHGDRTRPSGVTEGLTYANLGQGITASPPMGSFSFSFSLTVVPGKSCAPGNNVLISELLWPLLPNRVSTIAIFITSCVWQAFLYCNQRPASVDTLSQRLDPLAISGVFVVSVEEINQCVGHVLPLHDLWRPCPGTKVTGQEIWASPSTEVNGDSEFIIWHVKPQDWVLSSQDVPLAVVNKPREVISLVIISMCRETEYTPVCLHLLVSVQWWESWDPLRRHLKPGPYSVLSLGSRHVVLLMGLRVICIHFVHCHHVSSLVLFSLQRLAWTHHAMQQS